MWSDQKVFKLLEFGCKEEPNISTWQISKFSVSTSLLTDHYQLEIVYWLPRQEVMAEDKGLNLWRGV